MKQSHPLVLSMIFLAFGFLHSCDDNTEKPGPGGKTFSVSPQEIGIVSARPQEVTIEVTAPTTGWTATTDVDWARVDQKEKSFILVIDTNIGQQRETAVKVSYPGFNDISMPVIQESSFTIRETEVHFVRKTDDPQTIEVIDMLDSWSVTSDSRWLTGFKTPAGLDIYVTENTSVFRTGYLTVTPQGREPVKVKVTQDGVPLQPETLEGRYKVTGVVIQESDRNPSPTEWECEITVDLDLRALTMTAFGGVDGADVRIMYSVEEEVDQFRFYFFAPWYDDKDYDRAAGRLWLNFFIPGVFDSGYWFNPAIQDEEREENHLYVIGIVNDPEDSRFSETVKYVGLHFDEDKTEFTLNKTTYKVTNADEQENEHTVGIGFRIANVAEDWDMQTVHLRTAYYSDLVITKIGDL